MSDTILIVEDEQTLVDTIEYNLIQQGYLVISSKDGNSAIDTAMREKPDLIILDIMLPGIDGFEVCRILRKEMNTPILMLTARDDEIDRVVGLEVGADDYLTKPFSMRELQARIKALLRRVRVMREEFHSDTGESNETTMLVFSNLDIDLKRHEVQFNSQTLPLKPKEFDLLVFLANHKGQVLSRDLILEKVWGWDYFGDSRTVDVHIRWLREKIETKPSKPTRIITVRSAGYRFDG